MKRCIFLMLVLLYNVSTENDDGSTLNSTTNIHALDAPIDSIGSKEELKTLLIQSFMERVDNMGSFQNLLKILELNALNKRLSSKIDSLVAKSSVHEELLNQVLQLQSEYANCSAKERDAAEDIKPSDCYDLHTNGQNVSGIYTIYPRSLGGTQPLKVYCDMSNNGGGWTVFQRRFADYKPRVDFYRGWAEYKYGFGLLDQEFWLGLENIWAMTSSKDYTLRFDLADFEGEKRYAEYTFFSLAPENEKYKLSVSGYSGDAGDSFSGQNNMKFSTKDSDNDIYGTSCAVEFHGAWWYSNCHGSNLNGNSYEGQHTSYADGIDWQHWKGYHYSLKVTEMKIRPAHKPQPKLQ